MRHCPVCNVPLEPVIYETHRLWHCPQCRGDLVDLSRYKAIRRLPQKSLAELEAEAREGFAGDTAESLRCPRCHASMSKRPLSVPGFSLNLDVCEGCSLVWLDGGELAMAQLAHQATPGFRDTQEMKRRAEALSADPERKAAFDEAVARLPDAPNPFKEAFREALWDALFSRYPYRILR